MTKKDIAKKDVSKKDSAKKASASRSQAVTLHVVAYRKAAGLPVQLGVYPEILNLAHADAEDREVTLQWQLATEGYAFPTDGSAVVFTSPGAQKAFSGTKVDRTGRLAVVSAKNADGLAYAYTLSVIDKSTGLTAVLDPVVQNRLR